MLFVPGYDELGSSISDEIRMEISTNPCALFEFLFRSWKLPTSSTGFDTSDLALYLSRNSFRTIVAVPKRLDLRNMGSRLWTSTYRAISLEFRSEASTAAENLVFQRGFPLPEASIVVQYLLSGSIHPTANHWSLNNDDVRLSPRAEIKQTSTQIFPMSERSCEMN